MEIIKITCSIIISAISSLAFAEVSDKMPTITRIWIEGLIIWWVGFFCSDVLFMVWNTLFADHCFLLYRNLWFNQWFLWWSRSYNWARHSLYIQSVYGPIILMLVPLIGGFYLRTRHNQEVEQICLLTREEGRGDKIIKCFKKGKECWKLRP